MNLALRLLRNLTATAMGTRMAFPAAVLSRIEAAITQAETQHLGEIRFAIETTIPLPQVWRGVTPRQRALQAFSHLRVWDTHANNGVLIYVLRSERAVEIIADRGISAYITESEWQVLCREVEQHYRAKRYADGSVAAVSAVARLLSAHFPPKGSGPNELPNQPVLL